MCTEPGWRRKGLASRLLKMALAYMQDSGMEVSALHAATEAQPLYSALGFRAVPLPFHRCTISESQDLHETGETVRPLAFRDDAAWADALRRLQPLQRRFCDGLHCAERTEEYWRKWVRYPAEALDCCGNEADGVMRGWEMYGNFGGNPSLVAYIIVKASASFSSAYEASDDSRLSSSEVPLTITLLDFASIEPPGSLGSEAVLFRLLATAKSSFSAGKNAVCTLAG